MHACDCGKADHGTECTQGLELSPPSQISPSPTAPKMMAEGAETKAHCPTYW